MTEICAAMGLTNLESIDDFRDANRRNYKLYQNCMNRIPGIDLITYDETETCNYQYIVAEVGNEFQLARDDIIAVLHAENILARKYFWPGAHRMLPYRAYYPHAGMLLPNTNQVAERIIVLPTGVHIDEEESASSHPFSTSSDDPEKHRRTTHERWPARVIGVSSVWR